MFKYDIEAFHEYEQAAEGNIVNICPFSKKKVKKKNDILFEHSYKP